jgi:hypothetical protein
MPVNLNTIASILLELKTASLQFQDDPKPLMNKYDIMFLGEKFNIIYSDELRHSLESFFKISISLEELNQLLPSACKALNMLCEPMKNMSDLNNPVPAAYSIMLF